VCVEMSSKGAEHTYADATMVSVCGYRMCVCVCAHVETSEKGAEHTYGGATMVGSAGERAMTTCCITSRRHLQKSVLQSFHLLHCVIC